MLKSVSQEEPAQEDAGKDGGKAASRGPTRPRADGGVDTRPGGMALSALSLSKDMLAMSLF